MKYWHYIFFIRLYNKFQHSVRIVMENNNNRPFHLTVESNNNIPMSDHHHHQEDEEEEEKGTQTKYRGIKAMPYIIGLNISLF